jgi:hypothetical protein
MLGGIPKKTVNAARNAKRNLPGATARIRRSHGFRIGKSAFLLKGLEV